MMKWSERTLWGDPIGWSERTSKTGVRVFSMALMHLLAVILGLHSIWKHHSIEAGAGLIIFVGVLMPGMYLYAMRRLLRIIGERNETGPQNTASHGTGYARP